MKIVDCFIFNNELTLLKYRLALLYDIVDYFVLVESTHTFMGQPKPCVFRDNRAQFAKYEDKIIYILVDDIPFIPPNFFIGNHPGGHQWQNEFHQRNSLRRGIDKISLSPEDIIILSDVDEIPDPNLITELRGRSIIFECLQMDHYKYNLTIKHYTKWYHAKILSYKFLLSSNLSLNDMREYHLYFTSGESSFIQNAGWHMSCFADVDKIQQKLVNFSHQEFNVGNNNSLSEIKNRIRDLKDYDNRKLERVALSENYRLPPDYEVYLQEFLGSD